MPYATYTTVEGFTVNAYDQGADWEVRCCPRFSNWYTKWSFAPAEVSLESAFERFIEMHFNEKFNKDKIVVK